MSLDMLRTKLGTIANSPIYLTRVSYYCTEIDELEFQLTT